MRRSWVGFVVVLSLVPTAEATAATETRSERFTATDGVELQTTLTGAAPLTRRPVVVEFSPYGRASGTFDAGPAYNHLLVQIRGTGDSDGRFDALGPRTQADVAEVMGWACGKEWSDGNLGLNGFSASAITIYNSLHQPLPCLKGMVLKSGTHELYRDLLMPGGVSNVVPGAVVLFGIGGITLSQSQDRDPATYLDALLGTVNSGMSFLQHPTLDAWWRERGFRGDVNHVPTLMLAGFFDVESRGAFEGYRDLKKDGAHLYVGGAHDAGPKGTDRGNAEAKAWFDRYLRGERNGVEDRPRVQMLLSDGARTAYADGRFVRRDATDWPVPGTTWKALYLDARKSGSGTSINDGTLADAPPVASVRQSYPGLVSSPTNADVPNAAIVDASGGSQFTSLLPAAGDMSLAEPLGLGFTTPPLEQDLVAAGPASLELDFATTSPKAAIWAVVSDVAPGAVAEPLAVGRLSTDFPDTDPSRDLEDSAGKVVQPYGRYDAPRPATPGQSRRYRVEFWPLGNRFRKGHRIRLHLVGSSVASVPDAPGLNTVTVGGAEGSRLLVPVLPDAEPAAKGGKPCTSRRSLTVKVKRRYRRILRSARVVVGGRTVARLTAGRRTATVNLKGRAKGSVEVRIVMTLKSGRTATDTRTYRLCARKRR